MDIKHAQSEHSQRIAEKLERELGPLIFDCLHNREVADILLNPDGGIWVERLGRAPERLGQMRRWQVEALISTLASEMGTVITADSPVLECELPIDGSRFTAVIPPIATAPAFAIRRRASRIMSLTDYVTAGIMTTHQCVHLRHAIETRRNILIAGSTGSGKTTLANALIAHMVDACPQDRLVIIEDTPEIQCTAQNAVTMRSSGSVSLRHLLRTTLRFSPDRIIVGEVRGAEALEMLKAWNTGHPGGIATIHANSATDALTRVEDLVRETIQSPMQRTIAAAIHLIIFITRTASGRWIEELIEVNGLDGQTYITQTKE